MKLTNIDPNIPINKNVINLLKKTDAIFSDSHFVFTSGKHASRYLNKMALFAHPIYASEMGKLFAEKYKNRGIDVVVAPALGGIVLAQWVAYHLSILQTKDVISVYTEKDKGSLSSGAESNQIFTRGYEKYVTNKNILIVEDIVTTGISVTKVVKAVKTVKGRIVEVCAIANINPNPHSITDNLIGATFSSLAKIPIALYDESDCPMCQKGIPINIQFGHGKKLLEEKAKTKINS